MFENLIIPILTYPLHSLTMKAWFSDLYNGKKAGRFARNFASRRFRAQGAAVNIAIKIANNIVRFSPRADNLT